MNKASIQLLGRGCRSRDTGEQIYAVGIGANRPMSGPLSPRTLVKSAFDVLDAPPLHLLARSPILDTRPLGPSMRTYANAAALVTSPLSPHAMLDHLQEIERRFGRRRYRRWGSRTLDLDLLLWSGGKVESKRLTVPHAAFRDRAFVLVPLRAVAPHWRDPISSSSITHLAARLSKSRPVNP